MSVAAPAGFGDLARAQRAVADIYFGERRVGQAEVQYEPGRINFVDPETAVALLPDLLDPALIRQALGAGALDPHAERVCTLGSDRQTCGRLAPDVAGIIFDQDRFRVWVFINPRFLKTRAAIDESFLPRPTASLSLVDSVAGTIAGGSGGGMIYALQNRAVLAVRDARIVSTTSYPSDAGLQADVLAAQLDKPGLRYTAGMFWAPGIDLVGRRKIVGVGIETQFDTRSDKNLLSGSPLVVSLSQRARVDLLIDGRLVSSRTYETGNQALDTSGLPEGAYEVVLHIQEVGGTARDERRFFTKNPQIAPVGKTLWFAHGGVLVDEARGALLSPTRIPYIEGGMARRLSQRIALDTTVVGTSGKAIAEIGGYLITPGAQFRVAALGSTKGDVGVLFQANSTGSGHFSYTFDLRKIRSHDDSPLVSVGQRLGTTFGSSSGLQNTQFAAGSFTQLIGGIGYHFSRGQIGLSAYYRSDAGQQSSYAVGPTARWSVFQHKELDLTVEANVSQSNYGRSAFAGLRINLLRPHSSFGVTAGAQTIASGGRGNRSSLVGGLQATWQDEDVLGSALMLAGNLDHTPDSDLAHARADLRGPLGTVAADLVQQVSGSGGTQYSLGFQTAAVVNRDVVALGGKEQTDSVIAVRVRDAAPTARFEVLIDESPRGILRGGDTLPVRVTPYRQYRVRIRPIGGSLVHFDTADRRVSVYPGNVAALAWTVKPVVAMFGRMLWPDGAPIADADLIAEDAVGRTDPQGYFQLETSQGAKVSVRAADGRSCESVLQSVAPTREGASGYVALGTIPCRELPLRIAAK